MATLAEFIATCKMFLAESTNADYPNLARHYVLRHCETKKPSRLGLGSASK
jgi:hypothetical protein